ncbi:AMIN domain-containing protein [Bathymodiolus japonicus methanotrophic gill symbiont]|uniref:AMIN domain-containing protein n=1 Tax=Bathymodiolus japonicus methanotrophic gill symbiont TaxID=113269 RepID=UPI001E413B0C|nr:AMIN domain-containing protein [Bathymodiolus japonicus methanotrophic gill symbiont]
MVINLVKLVGYKVKVQGNRVIVLFYSSSRMARDSHEKITKKTLKQFATLLPEQTTNKIDFRRGKKGEGRLLIYLSNPNTVVNTQEKAGKIALSFLNTRLPSRYIKKMDVLDFATPVSMIEARRVGTKVKVLITPVNNDFSYSTGSNPNNGTPGDIVSPILSNLAVSNPYGALGMTLASGANYVLNLEISALQDDRKAEFISNPKVLTSDRCVAAIKQGVQIPFQTGSQNGTQTQFEDAAIILAVRPQITPSGSVITDLFITKDTPGVPTQDGLTINTRQITTSVHIEDGETVVLGGVFEGDTSHEINSVPWFADLPLIGWMFRKNDR